MRKCRKVARTLYQGSRADRFNAGWFPRGRSRDLGSNFFPCYCIKTGSKFIPLSWKTSNYSLSHPFYSFISPTKEFPQSAQFQRDLFCTLLVQINYFAMKMTSKLQNIWLFFLPSESTRNSAILSRSQQGPSVSAKLTSDGHACTPYWITPLLLK